MRSLKCQEIQLFMVRCTINTFFKIVVRLTTMYGSAFWKVDRKVEPKMSTAI